MSVLRWKRLTQYGHTYHAYHACWNHYRLIKTACGWYLGIGMWLSCAMTYDQARRFADLHFMGARECRRCGGSGYTVQAYRRTAVTEGITLPPGETETTTCPRCHGLGHVARGKR